MNNSPFEEVSSREFLWNCGLEKLLPLEKVDLEELWINYRGLHTYGGNEATFKEFEKEYKSRLKLQEDEEARRNSPFVQDYIKHLNVGE